MRGIIRQNVFVSLGVVASCLPPSFRIGPAVAVHEDRHRSSSSRAPVARLPRPGGERGMKWLVAFDLDGHACESKRPLSEDMYSDHHPVARRYRDVAGDLGRGLATPEKQVASRLLR